MQEVVDSFFKLAKFRPRAQELFNCVFREVYNLPPEVQGVRPSLVAFQQCYAVGKNIENALASSLLILNGNHGPFTAIYEVVEKYFNLPFDNYKMYVKLRLTEEKIPGFGSPVFKDEDNRCIRIKETFREIDLNEFEKYEQLEILTSSIIYEHCGKKIYTNLAFWNVAVIHYFGLPKTHSSAIFLLANQLLCLNSLWPQSQQSQS